MQTMLLVAWMVLGVGTPEGNDMQPRASSCLQVLEDKKPDAMTQLAERCGPLFTRPACAARFREFWSTVRRSPLRSLYVACREAYCSEPDFGTCPGAASEDPRILIDQWRSLFPLIIEREVGGDLARRINERLLEPPRWPGARGQERAPPVVRMLGGEGRHRIELFLEGKRVGAWKLSETPTPSEYTALLALLNKERPGDFHVQVRAKKDVIFEHLKLLFASLAAQGIHSLDMTVEKDAPPRTAR